MSPAPARILTFERCFNFRDLGGYAGLDGRPVRWRRLFRSMTPQYMSEADAAVVGELDISLVIDLRGGLYDSSGPIPRDGGTRIAVSPALAERPVAEVERFRLAAPQDALPRLLETYGPQFGVAVSAMADNLEAVTLFHCRLGKDRTGVLAALILKLLGVSDDDVIQDYLLTNEEEPAARRLLDEVEAGEDIADREPRVAREPVRWAAIEGVLQRLVSRYGGAYGYFAQHGVTAAQLSALVESLLEAPMTDLTNMTTPATAATTTTQA